MAVKDSKKKPTLICLKWPYRKGGRIYNKGTMGGYRYKALAFKEAARLRKIGYPAMVRDESVGSFHVWKIYVYVNPKSKEFRT